MFPYRPGASVAILCAQPMLQHCFHLASTQPVPRFTAAALQLSIVASAPLDCPPLALHFAPHSASRLLARSRRTASLFHLDTAAGKTRLLERALTLPPAAAGADVTAAAWHPSGLYLGTSAGSVFAYSNHGEAITASRSNGSQGAPDAAGVVDEQGGVLLCLPNGEHRAVASLVSHTTGFVAALAGANQLAVCSHADVDAAPPRLLALCNVAEATSIASLACTSSAASPRLVALSGDGLHLLLDAPFTAGEAQKRPALGARVLADAPCGSVTAAAPTGRAGEVATVSTDGTLRVWDAALGTVAGKRTFAAPLTAVAASSAVGVLAVGAASGVVRIVASGAADLGVASRTRLAAAPVEQLAACSAATPPGGGCLFAAVAGGVAYGVQANSAGEVVGASRLPVPADCVATGVAFAAGLLVHKPCVLVAAGTAEVFCVPLPSARVQPRNLARGSAAHRLPLPAPIVHMVCAQAAGKDSIGTLVAACADGRVRAIALPAATDAWESASKGGSTAAAMAEVAMAGATHGARLALLPATAASSSGEIELLHSSASGAVSKLHLRGSALTAAAAPTQLGCAGSGLGAAAALAASADGCTALVAAAAPAAVLSCHLGATKQAIELPEVPAATIDLDMDTVSDATEPLFDAPAAGDEDELATLAATPRTAAPSTPPAAGRAPAAAAAHATYLQLRQRFASLLARNATADGAAKLPRKALEVDSKLGAHMRSAAASAAAAVRTRAQRTDAASAIIAARVRAHCGAGAATQPATIGGLQTPTVVHNFASAPVNAEAEHTLSQLTFLRSVEESEVAARLPAGAAPPTPLTTAVDASGAPIVADDADATLRGGAAGDAAASHSSLISAAESGAPLLHSDWGLQSAACRSTNAALLSAAAAALCARFNNEAFAKAAATRSAAAERIAEGNARLAAIGIELAALGHTARPEDLQPFQVWLTHCCCPAR